MAFLLSCSSNGYALPDYQSTPQNINQQIASPPINGTSNDIKIALLLDTSGSMSGLLEQTKSQLWKIVNELSMAKKNDANANLEIALYQYGNDGLNSKEGYIEKVLPLTNDLDLISEKLFALSTNGGEEYCGHAIKTATNQLDWETENKGLNLIFIAGNESFNQGDVDYKESCKTAINKGISINTIFCGDYENGISSNWLAGAQLTEGNYMNIDMNQKTIYVETPFDQEISVLNVQLNKTYIGYGKLGAHKKEQQNVQDNNSSFYGTSNMVSRTISKSSHVYLNSSWDLVDAQKDANFEIEKVDPKTLPIEMQSLTATQKVAYVKNKANERQMIQNKINDLSERRKVYLSSNPAGNSANSLDKAMIDAIKKQAKNKGFTFNDNTSASTIYQKANVDFDYFEKVSSDAKQQRASRLINFSTFKTYSNQPNTIILDTRSKRMYDKMHVKGAIHINFSDFTQDYLAEMIPDTNTRILIYCNNNFAQEPIFNMSFASKAYVPPVDYSNQLGVNISNIQPYTLALNIPTYINLYGYHYRNVYELNELVYSTNPLLELEGTDVPKTK